MKYRLVLVRIQRITTQSKQNVTTNTWFI